MIFLCVDSNAMQVAVLITLLWLANAAVSCKSDVDYVMLKRMLYAYTMH